jgi:hypothetical protein
MHALCSLSYMNYYTTAVYQKAKQKVKIPQHCINMPNSSSMNSIFGEKQLLNVFIYWKIPSIPRRFLVFCARVGFI